MTTKNDLLARIEMATKDLSKSERRVASYILAEPNKAVILSIVALAEAAKVSEPTVARFCKSIGFFGLKELKIQLAKSFAGGILYVHRDVTPEDTPRDISEKVINRSISTLIAVRDRIDARYLGMAAEIIGRARHVEFYGQGNSGIVAQDAQHKFFRLGFSTAAYADPHVHAMSAALLGSNDVVVAISAGGRTRELLQSVEIAKNSNVPVVGITAGGSPLAKACTVTIATDVFEDPDIYSPMTSRLAHLAIIDVLAVAVSVAKGPALIRQLKRAKNAVSDKRIQDSDNS